MSAANGHTKRKLMKRTNGVCLQLLLLGIFTIMNNGRNSVTGFQPSYNQMKFATSLFEQKETPFFVDTDNQSANEQRTDKVQFGQSVPYNPPSTSSPALNKDSVTDSQIIQQNKTRNIIIAIASFTISILHYIYQFTHPITAVEILANMQVKSDPLTSIGNNGKPTVVDFWAPWCENCKVAAPTLQSIEQEYGDRVNFILVNGDDGRNWPLIQLFGVDAIPHLALLSDRGDVETALIGPMSRNVLRADIDALLSERDCWEKVEVQEVPLEKKEGKVCHEELPYVMYDAFGNRPDSRRINFVER